MGRAMTKGPTQQLAAWFGASTGPGRADPNTADAIADSVFLQRVAKTALQEIDDLLAELRRKRENLLSESARVQREIIEYAKLSQSAVQSTQIITQRLSSLKKVSDASVMSELHVEDISNEEHRASEAEVFHATHQAEQPHVGQPWKRLRGST